MKTRYSCLIALLLFVASIHASEISVRIGGAVYASGSGTELIELSLPAGSNLLDALVAAGGFSEAAVVKSVFVKRKANTGAGPLKFDAIKCLQNPTGAPILQDGDTIWVSEVMNTYPAPHYYNRLLFEWAFLKERNRALPSYWLRMVQFLDRRGDQEKTKYKEWSEPDAVVNASAPTSSSESHLHD